MIHPWIPVDREPPPTGRLVEVLTPGGDERELIFASNLWWLPDRSMYVYFTPRFWREAQS